MEDDDLSIDDLLAVIDKATTKKTELNPYLHYLNAKLVCLNCNQEYRGETTRQKKWFDKEDIVYTTLFCPCCPQPDSIEVWVNKTACIKKGRMV